MITGTKFRRASSNGSTLQMAAAGISAHGINVPPPTQMAAICPSAVNVAAPLPMTWEKMAATEPTREIPEKPEPSNPVMAPTTVNVTAPISSVNGQHSRSQRQDHSRAHSRSLVKLLPRQLLEILHPLNRKMLRLG